MNIWDYIKIVLKSEGFSGAVVALVSVILIQLKVPQEITTAVLGLVAVLLVALTAYVGAARIRAERAKRAKLPA